MSAEIIFKQVLTEPNNRVFQKQRHHLKMNDVLPLEIATIRILEFLFIASSQNGSLVI